MARSSQQNQTAQAGFTLLELIWVMVVIGVLVLIILAAIDKTLAGGRDAARLTETQELIKAAEMYYTDFGQYPDDNGLPGMAYPSKPLAITNFTDFLLSNGGYLTRFPKDPSFPASDSYLYCASDDRGSMTLFVHFERVGRHCYVSRGPKDLVDYCWVGAPALTSCTQAF